MLDKLSRTWEELDVLVIELKCAVDILWSVGNAIDHGDLSDQTSAGAVNGIANFFTRLTNDATDLIDKLGETMREMKQ